MKHYKVIQPTQKCAETLLKAYTKSVDAIGKTTIELITINHNTLKMVDTLNEQYDARDYKKLDEIGENIDKMKTIIDNLGEVLVINSPNISSKRDELKMLVETENVA